MNKLEMMQAVKDGAKVTHPYFSPDEWMAKGSGGGVVFEDGVKCSWGKYWLYRQGIGMESNWRSVTI
jgi:hypothetical protein